MAGACPHLPEAHPGSEVQHSHGRAGGDRVRVYLRRIGNQGSASLCFPSTYLSWAFVCSPKPLPPLIDPAFVVLQLPCR